MMQPKRTKYLKQQKGRNPGFAKGALKPVFGQYALKALGRAQLTARQIESVRRVLSGRSRRLAKIWIRVFPDKPITKKPLEVRQGKGKGSVEYWVTLVQPGRILFEISGVSEEVARRLFRLAGAKLPIKTTFVRCEDYHESE